MRSKDCDSEAKAMNKASKMGVDERYKATPLPSIKGKKVNMAKPTTMKVKKLAMGGIGKVRKDEY